jgi:hypothetical protein
LGLGHHDLDGLLDGLGGVGGDHLHKGWPQFWDP